MPNDNDANDAGAKLQKLGQRLRMGITAQQADVEHSAQAVRDAVRKEWENQKKSPLPQNRSEQSRERNDPEQER